MPKPSKWVVEWTQTASEDLRSIILYVASDSVRNAVDILDLLRGGAKSLNRLPFRGRIVPELARFGVTEYRELLISSWRTIYRVEGRKVYVLACLDDRRNLEDLLLERFLRKN